MIVIYEVNCSKAHKGVFRMLIHWVLMHFVVVKHRVYLCLFIPFVAHSEWTMNCSTGVSEIIRCRVVALEHKTIFDIANTYRDYEPLVNGNFSDPKV